MQFDTELRVLAERQHGVIARRQARALGASSEHLRRRIESPDWEAVSWRVLRLVGTQRTFRQRCMAAVLDAGPGAVVSYEPAATLGRLPGFWPGPMHVSRLTGRSPLAVVHRIGVPESHTGTIEGIPVTRPARTIFDLAAVLHPHRTERALDNALAHRLTTVRALRQVTEDLATQGRPGSALMRRLLAGRDGSYAAPESSLEARFESLVRRAGLPPLVRQREVGGDDWVGRVDYLDPDRRLIVEIDSDAHHTSLLDQAADARRDGALRRAGYAVVRLKEHEVWHQPEEVVRRLLAS
jgi:very-short-patch-repair endonuclease